MNTILVVTADASLRSRLVRGLGAFTVFEAPGDTEALKTLRLVDIDVVLRETTGPTGALSTFVTNVREATPTTLVVAIGHAGEEEGSADFAMPDGFTLRELDAILAHALDKQKLLRELRALKIISSPSSPTALSGGSDVATDNAALARVLKAFSRVFAAGFDLPRVLDTFLDAIGDVVRPTRVAILLPDDEGQHYRVVSHRGLAPQIVHSVKLAAIEGLPRWLASQGRPATVHELDPELVRELKLLQGVVGIPMLAHGDLEAILVLGQPVFGAGYSRGEIETLFDLATQLATVIRDISLHQAVEREKEFTDRILTHMSSGVITIGRDQRVGTINRRAEEILGLSADEVLHQDLRVLPSPLGDLLFEALSSGRPSPRQEIQLALRRLWIEVTTYPVRGEDQAPLGAVLVFEDLTAQKELAAQRREADQFQMLTRVVARIADEIKNPLVSINTFIELIGERYDDPEFRRHFSSVVRRDVRRLVEVFEKLAGLVTEGELNFATVDAHEVVAQLLVETLDPAEAATGKQVQLELTPAAEPQLVKVDPIQLRKALAYLIRYLTHNSPTEVSKVALAVGRHTDSDGNHDIRILVGSRTASVTPDKLDKLFDPVHMVQESLIDVGPAVSQRLIEALGGRLGVRQGKHELSFVISLPPAVA